MYSSVAANKRKSFLVIFFFIVFITFLGWVIGEWMGYGTGFVGMALIISGITSFFSFWYSDKIVLALSNAKQANKNEFFDFYTVTENLAMSAQLPMPRLYVIADPSPNAFATGRDYNHAVVCATTGLLDKLNRTELEGVVGHELSHIKNYDMLLMSIVAILVGMVALLADWIYWTRPRKRDREESGNFMAIFGFVLIILSPIIAQLIQLAISRQREFLADASSAKLTRQPSGLISALKKISSDPLPVEEAKNATAHLYIVNPFKKSFAPKFSNLFNTHPPVEKRIKALEKLI
ncbi:M48 family metallopeptidase [Candidatus Beckwithbacteria bacterium]|nr:M48 family metallopeptidase [Candidatus Beckwithbacteria bacterium]